MPEAPVNKTGVLDKDAKIKKDAEASPKRGRRRPKRIVKHNNEIPRLKESTGSPQTILEFLYDINNQRFVDDTSRININR
jgi:hypothetical protein